MSSEENSGGSRIARALIVAFALVILVGVTASSQASHLFSDTAGHTTIEQVVTGSNPQNGFSNLHTEPVNTSYVVRDGAREGDSRFPNAPAGRDQRRRSLAYFGQLTDFQLADEESPARVEFTDE
jgi:hypothetical protein